MPSSFLSAAALALLASTTSASSPPSFPRAVSGPGYLSVPIDTHENPKRDLSKVNRRDDDFLETVLDNREFWYSTTIGFGNPPQNITVLVDTGSSHLWINPDCETAFTTAQYAACVTFGEYDPRDSETPPIGPFGREELRYGDASDEATLTEARLRFFADDVWFAGVRLRNQTFGVAQSSTGISQGLFGLGPDLRAGFRGTDPHNLVLHSMAEQGLIASRVFAVDLRHAEAQEGALIYGGIDRNKFIGRLEKVPVVEGLGGVTRLTVEMGRIGVTLNGTSEDWELEDDDMNVLLDSGSTLSRLHYDVIFPVLEALGAIDSGEGYFLTDCSARSAPGSVNFRFGSKDVRVPFSDFIIDLGDPLYCYIGVAITTEQQILGDTVMRAGYFVFDWDNEEVHIGQAANCGRADIVAVSSGKDAVPTVEGKCDESDAAFTGTGEVTRTRAQLPTEARTTVYEITECPPFAQGCQTGVMTTETIEGLARPTDGSARPTVTVTRDGGGGEDDEDAGGRLGVVVGLVVGMGMMVVGWNLL